MARSDPRDRLSHKIRGGVIMWVRMASGDTSAVWIRAGIVLLIGFGIAFPML